MIQLDENDVARERSRRPAASATSLYPTVGYAPAGRPQPQPQPQPQRQRQPQPQPQSRLQAYPAPRAAAQPPAVVRRSKADALHLADHLKRGVAVGALVTFSALSLAVGSHIVTSNSNTESSSQTSSSSTQASQSASSGSQSSGVSGFSSSSSSSASSSTGVS